MRSFKVDPHSVCEKQLSVRMCSAYSCADCSKIELCVISDKPAFTRSSFTKRMISVRMFSMLDVAAADELREADVREEDEDDRPAAGRRVDGTGTRLLVTLLFAARWRMRSMALDCLLTELAELGEDDAANAERVIPKAMNAMAMRGNATRGEYFRRCMMQRGEGIRREPGMGGGSRAGRPCVKSIANMSQPTWGTFLSFVVSHRFTGLPCFPHLHSPSV